MGEELTEAEIIARLEIALVRMPKRQRDIFLAVRLDDMSYAQIAERTGLSVERVESEFARSLLPMADALEVRPPSSWWRRLPRWIVEAWPR